mmetsp:Transcript_95309/g.248482  ORF Transcript_95309/g.248482 Transcript_95309/m.248482 type:complete len:215 (-) Transcript_95309:265-909(-)
MARGGAEGLPVVPDIVDERPVAVPGGNRRVRCRRRQAETVARGVPNLVAFCPWLARHLLCRLRACPRGCGEPHARRRFWRAPGRADRLCAFRRPHESQRDLFCIVEVGEDGCAARVSRHRAGGCEAWISTTLLVWEKGVERVRSDLWFCRRGRTQGSASAVGAAPRRPLQGPAAGAAAGAGSLPHLHRAQRGAGYGPPGLRKATHLRAGRGGGA